MAAVDRTTAILSGSSNQSGSWYDWSGGTGNFYITGTIGAATVKLDALFAGSTEVKNVGSDTDITSANDEYVHNFQLNPCQLRATISASTGATVSAFIN